MMIRNVMLFNWAQALILPQTTAGNDMTYCDRDIDHVPVPGTGLRRKRLISVGS